MITVSAEPSRDLRDRLRDEGKRLTPQRERILAEVTRLGHATPDELVSALGLSASTVYRNLEVLEELGLIRHAHLGGRAPTYHSSDEAPHFHLLCRKCERVVSVDPGVMDGVVAELRSSYSFDADIGHLAVFGTCVECRDE